MNKIKSVLTVLVFFLIIVTALTVLIVSPDKESSLWERRRLAQFPELSADTISDRSFMDDFEKYLNDQFPLRDELRRVKARVLFDVFRQKDNNGIYIAQSHASKLDADITQGSIDNFCNKLTELYRDNLKGTDCKAYYCIIPDKNYFLAEENGYPAFDYDYVYSSVAQKLSFMKELDIRRLLDIDCYYTTDTHWRQEKLTETAGYIRSQMGMPQITDYESHSAGEFYGVYYGQSALPLECDELIYLENEQIKGCSVYNYESNETCPVYNLEKLSSPDRYDIYLSGATPLLKITNPQGEAGKRLVIFRDSFASSLTPLLLNGYEEIILIDTRYMMPEAVSQYVEFTNQDVLFIYSTMLVEGSQSLR